YMLTVSNLSKSYADQTLFENISFFIENNARSAIIGNNGTGKSTIFKIITGLEKPDSGNVFLENGRTLGYLPQDPSFTSNFNLIYAVISINNEITEAISELLSFKDTDLSQNNIIAGKYAEANAKFEHYNGYNLLEKAKKILKMLGFSDNEFNMDTSFLSGGQKTRALLGKLLLSECDLLLLDEPTNHLDYNAQELFVNYLNNDYKGSVLIISHDRYFLNQVATKIYDLSDTELYEYPGNYDKYLQIKKEKELTEKNIIEKNRKAIAKMEESVQTLFSHRNFSARDSMVKKLERVKEIQRKYENKQNNSSMKITLESANQSGSVVLRFENLSKTFDDKKLFENVNLVVEKEQKIGIVGPNGSGKSTFLKIINGLREADSGTMTYGHNVRLSYFAQEFEQFDNNKTLFDELLYNTELSSKETRELLAKFLFVGDDISKKVDNLSGGEKCRLALAKIMASKPNLLLLDEPTNHLDITSCEILENALKSYEGTLIIVSHDRYFLDKTTKLTIEIKDGHFTKYYGNYTYYREKSAKSLPVNTEQKETKSVKTEKKLNNREIREMLKPLLQKNKIIENEISLAENKINELSELLGDESVYKNGGGKEITENYRETEEKLENLLAKWENLQTEIDKLEKMLK
ncbi:MAG: ABC-F family ATP-binding cassette domain-containing protein, partial [Armatimonadetes bacterium]|nr:ABC-F family ATP-binding cassette domain-containing protein [Candidatus Hippobium faecium]